jgi:hypothetical protein
VIYVDRKSTGNLEGGWWHEGWEDFVYDAVSTDFSLIYK